jgi:glycosyltransferase involved in cell wall biosynthesis
MSMVVRRDRRLLVVSHASAVTVNQAVYLELLERGWDLRIVVPDRWHHDYFRGSFHPTSLGGLEERVRYVRTLLPGRPQRHLYLGHVGSLLEAFRPQVAFLEEETFSLSAFQWGRAAAARHVPFGVQAAENLDRPLPLPARWTRSWVLARAAFVAARSPTAGELAQRWGARGLVALAPHGIPCWSDSPGARTPDGRFTIGFAGRLVPQKGIWDLVRAVQLLDGPLRVLFVGDGPLRKRLSETPLKNGTLELWTDLTHDRMPEAYREMDVLVLPSRTTASWKEQFGRVLVEALWCGTPVIGSDSGEIPWVVNETGGGCIFPEGDVRALAETLARLRKQPDERKALVMRGRAEVERLFSVPAAAQALDDILSSLVARNGALRDG